MLTYPCAAISAKHLGWWVGENVLGFRPAWRAQRQEIWSLDVTSGKVRHCRFLGNVRSTEALVLDANCVGHRKLRCAYEPSVAYNVAAFLLRPRHPCRLKDIVAIGTVCHEGRRQPAAFYGLGDLTAPVWGTMRLKIGVRGGLTSRRWIFDWQTSYDFVRWNFNYAGRFLGALLDDVGRMIAVGVSLYSTPEAFIDWSSGADNYSALHRVAVPDSLGSLAGQSQHALAISPNGRRLAACGFFSDANGFRTRIYDTSDLNRVKMVSDFELNGRGCAFSPDGLRLAVLNLFPPIEMHFIDVD
jgi:hypothetical protein